MKSRITAITYILLLTVSLLMAGSLTQESSTEPYYPAEMTDPALRDEVFRILDSKCNTCHRRQNPFMVFKPGNMERRARKIYRMVFVEKRMPKGNEVKLTAREYESLENWLKTQQIL